jgi:hypothetical protein
MGKRVPKCEIPRNTAMICLRVRIDDFSIEDETALILQSGREEALKIGTKYFFFN